MPQTTTNQPAEAAVKQRYAKAAGQTEAKLCCPVDYNTEYLAAIPAEVIERDYGCGDPSRYLRAGETVLDLGSGTGKICFIASQVVGPKGKVIGLDMTDEMLEVARRNAPVVAERIGYGNVEFRKGRIQDLALDFERLDQELKAHPITDSESFLAADLLAQDLRMRHPLIASDSVDVVVSNCVLNLVETSAKRQLFAEIHRVLRNNGRAVISDIVSDENVPEDMMADPELWSGCISGALREDLFLKAFEDAGFYGITVLKRDTAPWQTVKGIEFRSLTVEAFKARKGSGLERNHAVIYKGPFKEVLDDENRRLQRGQRHAVCDKTFDLYQKHPYRDHFDFVEALVEIPAHQAKPFDSSRPTFRHPAETKGDGYQATTTAAGGESACCEDGDTSCC